MELRTRRNPIDARLLRRIAGGLRCIVRVDTVDESFPLPDVAVWGDSGRLLLTALVARLHGVGDWSLTTYSFKAWLVLSLWCSSCGMLCCSLKMSLANILFGLFGRDVLLKAEDSIATMCTLY